MSKFKIGIPLIFIIIFAFVLFVGGTMPYFLFYIFLLTFLLPLIHSLVALNKLSGSVKIPKGSLYTGDKINIDYKVENKSFFSIPYLEIQTDIKRQLTGADSSNLILTLEKKKSFTHSETIVLKRRGYYQLGEIKVIIRDVFRLYSFKKKIASSISLLVYPEIIELSTFEITASQQSGELLVYDSSFEDKSRVTSFRDYREGDSIKSMHWKLSAKKDSPIVKDYENRVNTNAIIFIDNERFLFKNDVERRLEDKSVDAALSIINYCLNQNIEVSLEMQRDKRYIEIQGQQKSDLKPFLEALARFKGNGTLDLRSLLISKIETIKKSSTVVVITPRLDKSMGANGIQMKMKNLNPLFIIVIDKVNKTGYIDLAVEKRLKQEGIPVYILDHNTSIKEALEVHHGYNT